jgi:hypothetical protein
LCKHRFKNEWTLNVTLVSSKDVARIAPYFKGIATARLVWQKSLQTVQLESIGMGNFIWPQ